jgi:hypothetical protein
MQDARNGSAAGDAAGTAGSGGVMISMLGLLAAGAAALASLMIWTLLTAPTDVAVAVAGGPSEVAEVMLSLVVEALGSLLSWL